MALTRIELRHIAVPLRKPIAHASHARTTSDNLVARAVLSSGHDGFGEGVPREYVTGETIETAFEALSKFDAARAVGEPASFEEAVDRIDAIRLSEIENDPRGMFGNAARCALELALLDAFSRQFNRSAGDAVTMMAERRGVPKPFVVADARPVRYSGAITAETPRKERVSAWKMRLYGFRQVKVKVGVAGQDDPARLARIRRILGRRTDLRIDANEAWNTIELVERVRPLLPFEPSVLEQPVSHAEVDRLAELRAELGVDVMLDESLCGIPDARRAIELGTADDFNVRLSKCGGIGPALAIIGLALTAAPRPIGYQLGCHPGETGLLSAAGRHFAGHVDGIRFLEGSYDRHVLKRNIIREQITFGYGGRAWPIYGPGLGVNVDRDALDALSVRRQDVSYD